VIDPTLSPGRGYSRVLPPSISVEIGSSMRCRLNPFCRMIESAIGQAGKVMAYCPVKGLRPNFCPSTRRPAPFAIESAAAASIARRSVILTSPLGVVPTSVGYASE
jgi:hypothetical protein